MLTFVLGGARETIRRAFSAQYRMFAGLAFLMLALAAIQYDEQIAPGVSRVSDAWASATQIGRKLFTA